MVRREPDCQNMRNLKYNMLFESSDDPPETHKTTVLGRKHIWWNWTVNAQHKMIKQLGGSGGSYLSGWMYGYYLAGCFRKISRYFPTWEQVRWDLQKWRWSLRFSSLDHRESLQFVAVVVINGSVGERSNAQRVKQPMTCVWCLEEFYKCLGRLTALKWASTHRRTQTTRLTQHGTNCKKQRRATLIVLVWLQHKFKTGHVHKKVDDKKKKSKLLIF